MSGSEPDASSTREFPMSTIAVEDQHEPSVTHALETLLGGLDPAPANMTDTLIQPIGPSGEEPIQERSVPPAENENQASTRGSDSGLLLENASTGPALALADEDINLEKPAPISDDRVSAVEQASVETPLMESVGEEGFQRPILLTDESMVTMENSLVGQTIQSPFPEEKEKLATQSAPTASENDDLPPNFTPAIDVDMNMADAPGDEEHPEWEVDSSPIESSSEDSSSDDSSSDESDEGDNAYKLLSPEEQARILMMEGGDGSDDEAEGKMKGSGSHLRTKNEIPEQVIPKPDVTIRTDMAIEELGAVEAIVESVLLIKAKTSGEYRVLESGSVLCLEDRSVIGVVSETLGRVQQPLYSVLFTNSAEITAAGLAIGTKVFYSEKHSTYVFTQALKAYKGSDASNLHDEEVGDEEMEFSDDEAEMEHKRKVKQKKNDRRGGKMQQNRGSSSGNHGHPLRQELAPYDASSGINYDDPDDDEPYKTLARPAGFADSVARSEAPQESAYSGPQDRPNRDQSREQFRGRGRSDRGRGDRGRNDRGRGRGDRGWGRGGYQDRRGGYSLPPRDIRSNAPTFIPENLQPQFQPQGTAFSQASPSLSALSPQNHPNSPSQEYSPRQPQLGMWAPFPPQAPFQPPFQQPYQQNILNQWTGMPQGPSLPGGAFLNPLFFGNNPANQQGQWNGRAQSGRGTGPK
jgi:H/ACA ribonucleoprotein complex non-core subunit NAF1